MTPIEQAEKVVRDLEEKREALLGRTNVLSRLRQELSYAAHTGDKTAKVKLEKINQEASMLGQEIESVEAAATGAHRPTASSTSGSELQ